MVSSRRILAVTTALLGGMLSTMGAGWGQPADCPAPMYGLNPANTGQSKWRGIAGAPVLAWEKQVSGSSPFPRSLALGSNGMIYTPGDDLYALRASDGETVWHEPLGGRDSRAALDAQGRLFAFEGGRLRARDAEDGSLLWTGAPSFVSDGEPVKIGLDGTIYAAEIRGAIYAYQGDGTLKWQSQQYGLIQYGEAAIIPAIDEAGNIYFGGDLGYVSLDPQGAERWRVARPAISSSRVILGPDGLMYYSAQSELYVRDPSTGALVRQAEGHDSLQAMAEDGTLYWTSNVAITATDPQGRLLWRYEREWIDWPLVVDAEKRVYGATQEGDIVALSASGQLLWELPVTDQYPVLYSCAPVIGEDGSIYVLTRDGIARIVSELARFHRGDPNNDGVIDISDGICQLEYLFDGGDRPSCLESADANNDGAVDCSDAIFILGFLFLGTPPPMSPGPTSLPCGIDPDPPGSSGAIGCGRYDHCE